MDNKQLGERVTELIDKMGMDIIVAEEKFKESISAIGAKYGFTKSGLTVSKKAVLSFAYEQLIQVAKGEVPVKIIVDGVEIKED